MPKLHIWFEFEIVPDDGEDEPYIDLQHPISFAEIGIDSSKNAARIAITKLQASGAEFDYSFEEETKALKGVIDYYLEEEKRRA